MVGPVLLRLRRAAARLERLVRRPRPGQRNRASGAQGGATTAPWQGQRRRLVVEGLVYVGAALFVLWVGRAIWVVIAGRPSHFLLDPDAGCDKTAFSCGVAGEFVMTLLSLALASAVFLFYRLRLVRGRYVRRARITPSELVPAAGAATDDVVGRDEICRVIIDDLRDRTARRPHVMVGGVGAGKTAVLIALTRVLAQKGAVPVVIRLRDAPDDLDFRELARARFISESEGSLLSGDEGEKVWRQLLKSDQVIVLADGLEEAYVGGDSVQERDNLIRLAIAQAQRDHLPLVIASRPNDALCTMKAALLDLEPLSEEAALEYLSGSANELDDRLEWLVETAAVTESPFYLKLSEELHAKGLLGYADASPRAEHLDTRGVDRIALRLRLIDTWIRALVKGHFHADLAMGSADRQAAVDHLSALACVGLRDDSLHVKFADLVGSTPPAGNPLLAHLKTSLAAIPQPQYRATEQRVNCAVAAANGMQLGLVEPYRDGLRFHHSIMQAYLGARFIPAIADDDAYMKAALDEPGRELLMALVLYSRSPFTDDRDDEARAAHEERVVSIRKRLRKAARRRYPDAKALDLLASALEIDVVADESVHAELAADLCALWKRIPVGERAVEDTKLSVVTRFGASLRSIGRRPDPADGQAKPLPAYAELFEIGGCDESYRVRIAAAQEIGLGGDMALAVLGSKLAPTELTSTELPPRSPGEPAHADAADPDDWLTREQERRRETMRAWLAPILAGSCDEHAGPAARNLTTWLDRVGGDPRGSAGRLPLATEVALAQGFKHAANRRPDHPLFRAEARDQLAERAREMLGKATFWFSRLTLMHALCLWALPATPHHERGRRHPATSAGSDPEALVDGWLALPSRADEHPFLAEARDLVVLALRTGQPERFIWIDESGVVMKVGTQASQPGSARRGGLWIPPSTGWSTLHPRAQRLVGDVLLLLNLAERGRDPGDRDRRLARVTRNDLPPCLTGDRGQLAPMQTVGMAKAQMPGSNCKDGCKFDLCPYPPKGEQAYRSELSEAFCRCQQALVSGNPLRRRTAPWQAALPKELRSFWLAMEERARR